VVTQLVASRVVLISIERVVSDLFHHQVHNPNFVELMMPMMHISSNSRIFKCIDSRCPLFIVLGFT
jgi:hypothetical protein